jgi:hypothetical protein
MSTTDSADEEALRQLEEVYRNGFVSEYEYLNRRSILEGKPPPSAPKISYSDLKLKEKLQIIEEILQPNEMVKTHSMSTLESELGIPALDSFWKIPSSEVILEGKIGKGYFSTVFKGSYHGLKVAVKHIIPSHLNRKEMLSINREVLFLKYLRHPHIF